MVRGFVRICPRLVRGLVHSVHRPGRNDYARPAPLFQLFRSSDAHILQFGKEALDPALAPNTESFARSRCRAHLSECRPVCY